MKQINSVLVLVTFFVLTSCSSSKSKNSINTITFNDFIGEWYKIIEVNNSNFDTNFSGLKWKIFSDSTVLISKHSQVNPGFLGQQSTLGPGSFFLMKIDFSESTNELIFSDKENTIKYKIIDFQNDKLILEGVRNKDLIKLKR